MNTRERIAKLSLSEALVMRALLIVWPRRNPVGQPNLIELLQEARDFGLLTFGAYLRVLRKNRRAVVHYDREPLDAQNVRLFAVEFGKAKVSDMQRKRYFFHVEGLARSAFEFEYGERYQEYCRKVYPQSNETQSSTTE